MAVENEELTRYGVDFYGNFNKFKFNFYSMGTGVNTGRMMNITSTTTRISDTRAQVLVPIRYDISGYYFMTIYGEKLFLNQGVLLYLQVRQLRESGPEFYYMKVVLYVQGGISSLSVIEESINNGWNQSPLQSVLTKEDLTIGSVSLKNVRAQYIG